MGEFLRKFTCKRLGAIDKTDVAAICASLRQFGCGISGGAEAVIHFRKLAMELWRAGKAHVPLCVIDIDQKNFFGSLEWESIRKAVTDDLPWRGSATARKHTRPVRVNRAGGDAFLSDRGTGQGDVDAPMEASLVQGLVAREARKNSL